MRFSSLCLALLAALVLCGTASAASLFYIRGGGDGHGIGMSQYGAYGYALHGKDYGWILSHYYRGTHLGRTDPRRVVRVLLGDGSAAFAGAREAAGKKLNPSLTYSVRALADGSLALIGPKGKQLARVRAPIVASGPGPLSLAGLGAYRGRLEFRPDGRGAVQTVDALGLDDYVRGVISAEVPASWAPAALEAQAVAARTYAITTNVGGTAFDLYRDTRSQMYGGVAAETPSTDAAVAATRGRVVTYNGAPVVTYFFNSSGGHTENIEVVWPGAKPEPWLRGVPDPYDAAGGDPYDRWLVRLATPAAAAKLRGLLKGRLIGIRVLQHGASPRIVRASVVGTQGQTTVTGAQLQQLFRLLTTYAAFTTITTDSGAAVIAGAPQGTEAVGALVSLVHQLVAGVVPALHGDVFPAPAGAAIELQRQAAGGWQTAGAAHLGPGGSFSIDLPAKGTYRIVYRGLNGPAVTVS